MTWQGTSSIKFLGFQTAQMRRDVLLMCLAGGTLACAIAFSTLQERLFRMEGFHFGGFLTLSTYLTYVVLAGAERRLTGDMQRRGRLLSYAWVSLLAMLGYYCTNASLSYLNYATRVVWKSCKVLPVMALGTALNKRSYGASQYGSAVGLVLGTALFTLADKEGSPRFHPVGVALIAAALLFDALTTNFEERLFFRTEHPASHAEVVYVMSLFSSFYCLAVLLATGELHPALAYVRARPAVGAMLAGSACAAYLSVSCVLLLIKHFDATHAEAVKSVRRVLQVLLSYLIYPKPAGWKTLAGACLVFGSLAWFHSQQQQQQQQQQWRPKQQQGHRGPQRVMTNQGGRGAVAQLLPLVTETAALAGGAGKPGGAASDREINENEEAEPEVVVVPLTPIASMTLSWWGYASKRPT